MTDKQLAPLEFTLRGSDKIAFYACCECGRISSPAVYAAKEEIALTAARKHAEDCCKPRVCECGVSVDKHFLACRDCHERNVVRRAAVVENYDGPVFTDGYDGDWGEGYFSSLVELRGYCEEEDVPLPLYVNTCTQEGLVLNGEAWLDSACDDLHEGARDQVQGEAELLAAVVKFNAAQTVRSYFCDNKQLIILDPVGFKNWLDRVTPETE